MKKLLPFLMMLITMGTYAQIKFEPGYFISNNNTKTECLIKNLVAYSNPTSFEYKINESSDVLIGKINEVKEFSVGESHHYKRFEVNIDQSSSDVRKLSTMKDPEWKKETLFLKLIIDGDIKLYQYDGSNLTRYFISSGDHKVAEQLIYKEYLAPDGSSVLTNNLYKRQLLLALKSEQLKQSDFDKLKYNKNSLIDILLKHNNQNKKSFTNLEEKQGKSNFNFKVNAGFNQGTLKIENHPYLHDYNSKISTLRVGVELEIIFSFGRNKWSFFADPNFQSFNHESKLPVQTGARDVEFVVNYTSIQIPIGIRHYFFLDKSKIFLNGGFNFNMSLNSKVEINLEDQSLPSSPSLFGGLGFNYDKYSLELRYNTKQKIAVPDYSYLSIIASYNFL